MTTIRKLTKAERELIVAEAFDEARFHGDGTVTVKEGFFYRIGKSKELLAARVLKAFPGSEILDMQEHYNRWPKDSCFAVKFRPVFGATEGAVQ